MIDWKPFRLAVIVAMTLGFTQTANAEPDYREGQVWEYHTRPGDEGSLLRIQKVEQIETLAKQGPVYHISIIGVHFQGVPPTGQIQHLPVSKQTLDASVTRLSSSSQPFPDPTAGIEQWRAAKGGVFTIPIDEIVAIAEQTARQNPAQ